MVIALAVLLLVNLTSVSLGVFTDSILPGDNLLRVFLLVIALAMLLLVTLPTM